jgi:hypothetical protein
VLAGTPILVSAAHGDRLAGVRRDAEKGHLWLAHWTSDRPDRVAGTRLEGREPARIGLPGAWIVGARLPAGVASIDARGASGAWHEATLGDGAWVVVVDGPEDARAMPPIRMLDAAGALVSRAEPGWLEAARRLSAQETALLARGPHELGGPCPVCWSYDWRAAPQRSGERIFCARCGHNEGGATVFYGPGSGGS